MSAPHLLCLLYFLWFLDFHRPKIISYTSPPTTQWYRYTVHYTLYQSCQFCPSVLQALYLDLGEFLTFTDLIGCPNEDTAMNLASLGQFFRQSQEMSLLFLAFNSFGSSLANMCCLRQLETLHCTTGHRMAQAWPQFGQQNKTIRCCLDAEGKHNFVWRLGKSKNIFA